MNARIKEKKEPDNFKPFTLEIDVETLDELKYLWMAFNISINKIIKGNENSIRICNYMDLIDSELISEYSWILYRTVDKKLQEINA